jgi:hypothetical protein
VPLPEFWRDEKSEGRSLISKQLLRYGIVFALVFAGVLFAFWWSGSALKFSASRVDGNTAARYAVSGVVIDARSGGPVPWAVVRDDPSGRPPLHATMAGVDGAFKLLTVAEPHYIEVAALGYKPARLKVGKTWYMWMPAGAERLDVKLEPEH